MTRGRGVVRVVVVVVVVDDVIKYLFPSVRRQTKEL